MKFFLLLLAGLSIALAWLLPIHYRPWVTYTGELFAFLSLFCLSAIYLRERLQLSFITLPLLVLACIPLLQWGFGQVFFFDKALLCSIFIFSFWLTIQLGHNLSKQAMQQQKIFTYFCYVLLIVGLLSSFIATCQWLNVEHYFYGMSNLLSHRPYANFAQPNNLSTFLLMCLLACLYLHEKKQLPIFLNFFLAFFILLGIALSQSRTAFVSGVCILIYGAYQAYHGRLQLKWYSAAAWAGIFIILTICLPIISQWMQYTADLNVTKTVEIAARTDMSRLAIWEQMWAAIVHQPWWGYGWHQTSVAYALISDAVQGPVWVRSAHNFVLDFLLWNGLIIGVPFLLYFVYWAWTLHRQAHSVEAVIGILMVGVFLIHALLEFPQNYAYFLLPIGFILGVILADQQKLRCIHLSPHYLQITFVIGLVLLLLIYRDYSVMVPKWKQAMQYENQPEKMTNHDQIYLLEEFDRRIDWIILNPQQKLSKQQLDEIGEIVLNYPIPYDLIKYAKALAFNGYEDEARQQLDLLYKVRKMKVSYESLFE